MTPHYRQTGPASRPHPIWLYILIRKIALLLLEYELDRAVIRPQDFIMDNHIFYTRYERLRYQEIIKPPADTTLTGVENVRPPRVLHALRIQLPEDIHKSVIEIFLHPCAFLGQKAGSFLV